MAENSELHSLRHQDIDKMPSLGPNARNIVCDNDDIDNTSILAQLNRVSGRVTDETIFTPDELNRLIQLFGNFGVNNEPCGNPNQLPGRPSPSAEEGVPPELNEPEPEPCGFDCLEQTDYLEPEPEPEIQQHLPPCPQPTVITQPPIDYYSILRRIIDTWTTIADHLNITNLKKKMLRLFRNIWRKVVESGDQAAIEKCSGITTWSCRDV